MDAGELHLRGGERRDGGVGVQTNCHEMTKKNVSSASNKSTALTSNGLPRCALLLHGLSVVVGGRGRGRGGEKCGFWH